MKSRVFALLIGLLTTLAAPGSETRAWPSRASNGPMTQKLARIFETSS